MPRAWPMRSLATVDLDAAWRWLTSLHGGRLAWPRARSARGPSKHTAQTHAHRSTSMAQQSWSTHDPWHKCNPWKVDAVYKKFLGLFSWSKCIFCMIHGGVQSRQRSDGYKMILMLFETWSSEISHDWLRSDGQDYFMS